jgi:hypothetical protein
MGHRSTNATDIAEVRSDAYGLEGRRSTVDAEQDAEELEICILRAWALVHGFAAISCMSGVETSIDWENLDDRFIN